MRCFRCHKGPTESAGGVAVFRVTPPGERPAVWACAKHIKQTDAMVDPEVRAVVEAIEGKPNER